MSAALPDATTPTREDLAGTAITSVGNTQGSPVRIPAARYWSPEFARLEHERVWPRTWQVACSVDHVAQPGDYYEYVVDGYAAIVVRGRDGVLRAFQNACKHRGNVLCTGTGQGLRHLRCPYHGWLYDLRGELQGVPSRKGFGEKLDRASLSLSPVAVDTWGPLVFVNFDADAMPLAAYLEKMPSDAAWLDVDTFRCVATITTRAPANWKLVADGFSETYHLQTLHREMLGSVDDVDAPQEIWGHAGVSRQLYGVPSPRLARANDQVVWDSFIVSQGERMGVTKSCPAPPVPEGETMMDVIAERIRAHQRATKGIDLSRWSARAILELHQYNVFPNLTVLVNGDLLQVLAARPGDSPDDAILFGMTFEREAEGVPRARPFDVALPMAEADFGFVLNQDVEVLKNAQRGVRQPGFTHLNLSCEEARLINTHRNLERYIGIEPSEITGGPA
ncbi:MAG: aromatic ring-hydroxylating dioxygenase subunit alpha [Myxococcales bacterium]|nr:aromatic ring-hydroxylating dioxygenase subunit alpha [Myxococcales bacterium]